MTDTSLAQLPAPLRRQLEQKKQLLDEQRQQLQTQLAHQCRQYFHNCLIEAEKNGLDDPETHAQEQIDAYAQEQTEQVAAQLERLELEWNNAIQQALLGAEPFDSEPLHDDPSTAADTSAPPQTPLCPPQRAITPADYLVGTEHIEKRGSKKKLRSQHGLLVVQSVADVDTLAQVEILAVGLVRPQHTPEQLQRLVNLSRQYSEDKVQTWLPLDEAGRQAMWKLVQQLLPEVFVRVPITTKTKEGLFANKAPADLNDEQLQIAKDVLR